MRLRLAAAAVSLVLLLSACGLLRPFIGDPDASLEIGGDPVNLTVLPPEDPDTPITAEFDAATNPSTDANPATGDLVVKITEDVDTAPPGLKPDAFRETIGLAGPVTFTPNPNFIPEGATATNVSPETMILTSAVLTVTTYDGTGQPPAPTGPISKVLQSQYPSGDISLVLNKGDCTDTTCGYTFADAEAATDVLEVVVTNEEREVPGEDFTVLPYDSLYEIRTSGEPMNTTIVALQVQGVSGVEALPVIPGSFIELEFTTKDGRSVL